NYLAQGALVLANPKAIENPFFLLYPDWALLPMVVLATAATVIASQAVITGAYSLTRQAIQLGLLPRMEIRHTSETHAGQIYMPLAFGGLVMLVMYTWRRGSRFLFDKTRKQETPLRGLVAMLEKRPPAHVPGTAVFLTSDPTSAPTALMHSLKHYKVLHEKNV